jgi:hypothetical protein
MDNFAESKDLENEEMIIIDGHILTVPITSVV